MKDFLEKISPYKLFNHLMPGIVFVFVLSRISEHNFLQKDLLIGVFLYYFIGLIISRIGSIVIEPLLKKLKFLNFTKYSDFVIYSTKDDKIEVLSETNNMYRTIIALIFSIFLVLIFDWLAIQTEMNATWNSIIILTFLLSIFLFSYKKQTSYISKRINAHKENDSPQRDL